MSSSSCRNVVKTVYGSIQREGHGAKVRRCLGGQDLRNLDPFLLFDELVECELPNGFPDHAHRGFETVTYVLSGCMRHEDFCGHEGLIGAGDVQWMTAGRGIVHSEMPHTHGNNEKNHGFQLWVNLEAKDKMCEPQYQEMKAAEIPTAEADGVKVKVIAGESLGAKSPVVTRTPSYYLDFTLQRDAEVTQPIPRGWNSFAYVISGQASLGQRHDLASANPYTATAAAVFDQNGENVRIRNSSSEPLRILLLAGRPIGEPIVQHGPFVMNTKAEIEKTFQEYRNGTNGFENAPTWRSKAGIRS